MKKWKKFIAMGLAVSMIVPSCIPQTLWASEFSAGSVESAADVFEDGAEYETGSEAGNKISDENNSGDEFGTGELKDQEPEQPTHPILAEFNVKSSSGSTEIRQLLL